MEYDAAVIIVGGGLAGLVSAIHLKKAGIAVLLIEKNPYPHHKVCGEYISNEVIPYLNELGINPETLAPTHINKFQLSNLKGKVINANLPLGGFGISRYAFDYFLYQRAVELGVKVIFETVESIEFIADSFIVKTSLNQYTSQFVLGAYGKRANLDKQLNRKFITKSSPFLAVKAHYKGSFQDDLVALHNFDGGYCGVSKVENDTINLCYLVNYASFKKYKNIQAHQEKVLYQNIHLRKILVDSKLLFETPLTISQISFDDKEQVKNHVLMIGDSAGLIHPLCGNGMSMAIHSAKICAELLISYFEGRIIERAELECKYQSNWNQTFNQRLQMGRWLSKVLAKEQLANILMKGIAIFPKMLPLIIKNTHGKPITI